MAASCRRYLDGLRPPLCVLKNNAKTKIDGKKTEKTLALAVTPAHMLALTTGALVLHPLWAVAPICRSRLQAARCRYITASGEINNLPDDDKPSKSSEDGTSISIGDVLAEIASRQLVDVDPFEAADARLDTLLHIGASELNQVLENLDNDLDNVQRNMSESLRVEMEAVQEGFMQRLDAATAALDAETAPTREYIRRAVQEERRAAAEEAERAGMSGPERARALARIAAAKERPVVIWCERSASALGLMAFLAVAALLLKLPVAPPLQWSWTLAASSAMAVYATCIARIVWEADDALIALDAERLKRGRKDPD
jgi:hypothetical protein